MQDIFDIERLDFFLFVPVFCFIFLVFLVLFRNKKFNTKIDINKKFNTKINLDKEFDIEKSLEELKYFSGDDFEFIKKLNSFLKKYFQEKYFINYFKSKDLSQIKKENKVEKKDLIIMEKAYLLNFSPKEKQKINRKVLILNLEKLLLKK